MSLAEAVVASDDAATLLDGLAPQLGEIDTVATADQELGAEVELELLEPPGERRLADADPLGGVGDRAGIGDGEKGPEQDEIHTCDSCMLIHAYYALYTSDVRSVRSKRARRPTEPRKPSGEALGIPALPLSAAEVGGPHRGATGCRGARTRLLWSICSPTGCRPAWTRRPEPRPPFLTAVARARTPLGSQPDGRGESCSARMLGGYNVTRAGGAARRRRPGGDGGGATCATPCWSSTPSTTWPSGPQQGNPHAGSVLRSWAAGRLVHPSPGAPAEIHLTVFKVEGEINDRRPVARAPGLVPGRYPPPRPARCWRTGRTSTTRSRRITKLKGAGRPDRLRRATWSAPDRRARARSTPCSGTSAHDIPFVPNKRQRRRRDRQPRSPRSSSTPSQDAGALPIECDVAGMTTGDHVVLRSRGRPDRDAGRRVCSPSFTLRSDQRPRRGPRRRTGAAHHRPDADATRPGGPSASDRARLPADRSPRPADRLHPGPEDRGPGVRHRRRPPGTYCEPVGLHRRQPGHHRSDEPQRARGAGLPRVQRRSGPADVLPHRRLPEAGRHRDPADASRASCRTAAGSSCGPATASSTAGSTGCCFPTRWAPAATRTPASRWASPSRPAPASSPSPPPSASCPSTCPSRCWSGSRGDTQPGITLRDLVTPSRTRHASRASSRSTPTAKRNVFSGRIIEIEGLEHLTVEQAFELSDSTAERSAAGCTIAALRGLGGPVPALQRRRCCAGSSTPATRTPGPSSDGPRPWSDWLADPTLLRADPDAGYAAVIEIDVTRDHRAAAGLPERSRRRPTPLRGRRPDRSTKCSSDRA